MLHSVQLPDVARCHGCGLCALVCPVYQQGGSVLTTPHGMAKAKQGGGELNKADVMACMLCGACAPLCPQDIDLMQMLVALRAEANQEKNKGAAVERLEARPANNHAKSIFIADHHLLNRSGRLDQPDVLERVMRSLGNKVVLASDAGTDISWAMREGRPVSHARLHEFLTTLQSVKQIIISDGLLYQLIREKLPQIAMQSLGEYLSSRAVARQKLGKYDLYILDTQTYHANYAMAVIHYDRLHKSSGCRLARDLHWLAVSTGAQALNNSGPGFDCGQQIEWLLSGRKVKRIVTESVADIDLLSQHPQIQREGICVVHVAELVS